MRRGSLELQGVSLDIVCGNVPVVSLDKDSIFDEQVPAMLQSACNNTMRADSLYDDCNDREILAACRRLGLDEDYTSVVMMSGRGLQSVKAVGINRKRSVMMACCIAMSIKDPDGLEELWELLRSVKLHRPYYDLLELLNNSGKLYNPKDYKDSSKWGSKSRSANDETWRQSKYTEKSKHTGKSTYTDESRNSGGWNTERSKHTGKSTYTDESTNSSGWKKSSRARYVPACAHGVDILFVCDSVPVVSMEKDSIFDENAALMLQSACDSTSKADALYVDIDDQDIVAACRREGLKKDYISMVRLRRDDLKSLRAVGVTGKRSTMIACCVAMSLNDPDGLEELWEILRSYKIHREYYELLELLQVSGQGSDAYNTSTKWTGKRKSADDGRWTSESRWTGSKSDWSQAGPPKKDYSYGSQSSSWQVSEPKAARKGDGKASNGGRRSFTTEELDSQLDNYFDK